MKYILSACSVALFLILFSCEEGGELPSRSQKSIIFSQTDESFKAFLASESSREFSDINSGYFGDSEVACGALSTFKYETISYVFGSGNCYYNIDEENNLEIFSIGGSAFSDYSSYRRYVYISFANMGAPQSGTYRGEIKCNDDFCYYSVFLGVYVIDSQNKIIDSYYNKSPVVHVLNTNGVVTASFEETFYWDNGRYVYPVFDASGSLSCCM